VNEPIAPAASGHAGGRWVEPDLYWCGPSPPPGDDWSADDWVELPHESYIPISKARLNETLLAHPRGRAAGSRLEHLLRLVEGLYHFHHHETLNQLKQDYEIFSPDADQRARDGLSSEALAIRERRFIGNFMKATILGNFTALSDADYRKAVSQSYLLDVPVEIDWRRHDTKMLERFFRHADGRDGEAMRAELGVRGSLREHLSLPHEIGNRAVVFYRGIDRDRTRGRFVPQRIDLLFNKTLAVLAWPVLKPIQVILAARRDRAGDGAATSAAGGARGTLFERRWVRRKNLHNLGALRRLFRTVELQEPVLRQVLILFRLEGDPTIHLKMFRNIPLADSEMIFPETIIRMGSFDRTMLVVSAAAAVFALGRLIAEGAGLGGAALAILVGGGMLVARIVGRYLNVRRKYMARMARNLYEKNLDNSIGVLQYLVDSLEEQEYKEAVLVYVVLWIEERAMSAADLDAAVERFVHAHLGGIEIDFEIDDALRKVVDLGVVEVSDGRFRARGLDDALRALDERWDGLFRFAGIARRTTA
jgi:hypothetical protein